MYLPRRAAVIHRVPRCKNFHYKNAETIHVTSLIQHASAGILRGNIARKRSKMTKKTIIFFYSFKIVH